MSDLPIPLITVSQETLDGLNRRAEAAELRNEMLRKELEEAKGRPADDAMAACIELIGVLKTIADHAVANLAPEFIKDLPAEAFEVAANLVDKVPGSTVGVPLNDGSLSGRDSERAMVWRERAKLIQDWRDKRKARAWEEGEEPRKAPAPRKPAKKRAKPTAKTKARWPATALGADRIAKRRR